MLRDAAGKVSHLTQDVTMKYKHIAQFKMGPDAIHIQARCDHEKQWLTTLYKLTDAKLEAIINECPIEWKVLINIEELSDIEAGPPPDFPFD